MEIILGSQRVDMKINVTYRSKNGYVFDTTRTFSELLTLRSRFKISGNPDMHRRLIIGREIV